VTTAYGSLMAMGAAKLAARHTFIVNPEDEIVRAREAQPQYSEEMLSALSELQKQWRALW
jgi:peroxiredoxin